MFVGVAYVVSYLMYLRLGKNYLNQQVKILRAIFYLLRKISFDVVLFK